MHKTRVEARDYGRRLAERLAPGAPGRELAIAPPFTLFDEARDPLGRWALAAQDVAAHAVGAFTGEVSAGMLAEAGCRYALVGHSERRRLFGETPATLTEKLARCREAGLLPIYCLGETEEERGDGLTEAVLMAQVETLSSDPAHAPLVVAYEPVWAIGTGNAATPADAAAASRTLRRLLSGRSDVRLLYGGSVTPANARDLILGCEMDGFLIGGASLDPDGFAAIAGI
jgi:triosephosphate isomerase